MKRVVSSSVISLIILLLIAGGFFYFQQYRSKSSSALDVVPSDVAWLISCDPSSGELKQLSNTGFFTGSDTIPFLKEWKTSLLTLDSIAVNTPEVRSIFSKNELIITGHVTGNRNFSLLYITRLNSNNPDAVADKLVSKLMHAGKNPGSRNYNGTDIREMHGDNGAVTFAYAVSRGVFIGSTAPYLVEDAIRQQRSDKAVSPAVRLQSSLRDAGHHFMVAVRYEGFQRWVQTQLNQNLQVKLNELERVGDWSVVTLTLHPNLLSFDGITLAGDSSHFLNLFEDQQPVKLSIKELMPVRTAALVTWGFSQPDIFFNDLRAYLKQTASVPPSWENQPSADIESTFRTWMGNDISLMVMQPQVGSTDNHFFALIAVQNESACITSLKSFAKNIKSEPASGEEEVYNGYTIRYIPGQGLMSAVYGPLFAKVNRFYYTIAGKHLIVTNQVSALRGYINDLKTGNLVKNDDRFISLTSSLQEQSNLFFYCNIPQSERLFRSVAAPTWVSWLAKYSGSLKSWNGLAFQISTQNGIYKSSGTLGYFPGNARGPELSWSAKLDTTILAGPFQPAGSGTEIIVQDQNLQVYGITTNGTIAWKKKIESTLRGQPHAVDYYGNGSHQYLFNSGSFLYLVDSLGNNTGNYPIRLPAGASCGMTVADWDTTGSARTKFYVACTNLRLYGYELEGKPLPGFGPVKLPAVIKRLQASVKSQGLYMTDEGSTSYFVNRKGQRDFTVKSKTEFVNGTYFMNAADTTKQMMWISPDGTLNQFDAEGIVTSVAGFANDSLSGALRADLNGDGADDWFFAGASGMRAITDDNLSIFKYRSEEQVQQPVFAQSGSRFYLAVPGRERIFLLNRDGSLADGFPQPGAGPLVLTTTTDGTVIMIYRGDNQSVNLMEIH